MGTPLADACADADDGDETSPTSNAQMTVIVGIRGWARTPPRSGPVSDTASTLTDSPPPDGIGGGIPEAIDRRDCDPIDP
jgi:hypothetical protein